jgi:hypothetical protein
MPTKKQIPMGQFQQWIWQDRRARFYLISATAFSMLAFIWFKSRYPYPNFLPDSYSYLEAAFNNKTVNMWPIGYSKFLRLFSGFTRWDTAQVFIQFAILQTSTVYFALTVFYLLSPGKWASHIIFVCCVANPLSLYVSNFISSDALFASLSLIWLTQILWILNNPNSRLLVIHAVVLVLALMVRYNALFYPIISLIVIGSACMKKSHKMIGIASIVFFLGGFIGINLLQFKQLTGKAQFSPFGGWQLASNALFAYAHSIPDPVQAVPERFRSLHGVVNRHMDSISRLPYRPDSQLGIYYLWDEHAPLKQYLRVTWRGDAVTDDFKKWASMGPLYSAYGSWLIRRHPIDFAKYFLWPNMVNYYVPNTEFLGLNNMKSDSVEDMARLWFHYKSNKITIRSKEIGLTEVYPILLALVNLLFVLSFFGFWLLGGFKKLAHHFTGTLLWFSFIWLSNFSFSVFASPIVLRYQVFPLITTFCWLIILLEFLIRENSLQESNLSTPATQVKHISLE